MNKITLTGNLVREPELKETTLGKKYCKFSLAVKRDYKDADGERKADFFDCIAWNGLAENLAKYVCKGNKVLLSGPVERRTYEDSNGVTRTSFDVVVKELEFLTAKTNDIDAALSEKIQDNSEKAE